MTPAGAWLYEVSARFLDAATVESLVAPTIADMQHEVSKAGDHARRAWLARARGYCAFTRLLFVRGIIWRSSMRRVVTVLALGGVGTALTLTLQQFPVRQEYAIPLLFLGALVVSLLLRNIDLGGTYRQMFVNCMGIGMLIATTSFLRYVVLPGPRHWFVYVRGCAILLGYVTLASVLSAALAWRPAAGAMLVYHRRVLDAMAGCFVCAIATAALGRWTGPGAALALTRALVFAFFFAVVSLAIYMPVLLGAGRVMRGRLRLAILGAVLCPIPLLGLPFVAGGFRFVSMFWRLQTPMGVALSVVPYLAGGAVLGWLLAAHSGPLERTAA